MSTRGISLAILLAALTGYASAAPRSDGTPYLDKSGPLPHLVVDGKPFLILGGELRNSSTSSLDYMKPIWPRMAAANFNTLLAVATWEQVEPQQGNLDFTYVDAAIAGAEENHLHLVFLWFGSWKNGTSSYPPTWVKSDMKRFPRVHDR
jgi:beta-galactosidase GanA